MGTRAASVLVWDRDEAPPPEAAEVLLWRSFAEGEGTASVPRRLEEHAERLRAKYLAFIHDLGEHRIGTRSVAEHLALDDGFSFWWMTWLAEKSPFKSPGVYDSLRLLALEEILLERRPGRLELSCESADLSEAIGLLCRNLGIEFSPRGGARAPRRGLPEPVRGAASLAKRLAARLPFRGLRPPGWFPGEEAVFFCSYFTQVDSSAAERGEFRSPFWENLPEAVRSSGRRTNWLHQFLPPPEGPEASTAIDQVGRFNADAARQGAHAFLDSFLGWGVAARALGHWARLNAARWRLRGIAEAFAPKGSAVRLWPVLRRDWRASLSGSAAAANALWVELFDAALGALPAQKTGLYLCEGVGWEMAFLRAWRRHGHGEVAGVLHSTVPFWHLYNFDDPRPSSRPRPDRLAVNGPAARRTLAGAGQPAANLVEVEALRYLKLSRLSGGRRPPLDRDAPRVLILGDVIAGSMRALLTMTEKAAAGLPPGARFSFKPHPSFPVDLTRYPGLRAEVTTAPLAEILERFDAAVSANGTSACVDAHLAGLPVVVALNGFDLNLSPLRGESGVRFAGSAEEMAAALKDALSAPRGGAGRDDFFFLDPELPRWRRMLRLGTTIEKNN